MIVGWMQLIGGLIILVIGGEFIVRSSVRLALYLNVSSLVIGLTVVSFGTSFPELVVSLNAALEGYPDISLGNVIGSNIANLALVLGITALLFPMRVQRTTVVLDWPVLLIASLLLVVFSLDNMLLRWEGAVLFSGLIFYNGWVIQNSRKMNKRAEEQNELPDSPSFSTANIIRTVLLLLVSLVALIIGAELLVDGAVIVARGFGVEERVIAITIIAFGTSAPELATSLIAVYKKEPAISVGNLIGSNIFNIMGILALTAIVKPISVHEKALSFDYFWMIGIPLLLYPFLLTRMRVTRLEGILLFSTYIAYIIAVL